MKPMFNIPQPTGAWRGQGASAKASAAHRQAQAQGGASKASGAAPWPRFRMAALAGVCGLLLAGCQSQPPVPDWQINAKSASERFTHAQLSAHTRSAQAELAQARREIASTGRPDLVARLELLACAVQVASVDFADCPAYEALAQDAQAPEQAYAAHLAAQPLTAAQIALLPAAQQGVARHLAQRTAPAVESTDAAPAVPLSHAVSNASRNGSMVIFPPEIWRGIDHTAPEFDLKSMEDPLSRLVAAGVLMRAGMASAAVVAQAVDTASAQGWRRPLLAWLGVQAKWAQAAGHTQDVQAIERRMQLVAPLPPQGAAPAPDAAGLALRVVPSAQPAASGAVVVPAAPVLKPIQP